MYIKPDVKYVTLSASVCKSRST